MAIKHAIWKVGAQPQALSITSLATEQIFEDMIVAAPEMLSDEWMLIGRQINCFSGRIDLLAIAPDGALILIEMKRDRTPREVVAQALDYACWVEGLASEDIAAIYARFAPGRRLEDDFQNRFGQKLDEETLNDSHQIIVVAGSLDESSERIVGYLNARGIAINVLCFQVFQLGDQQLISRAWLIDPVETQTSAAVKTAGPKEPWNGEFYVSFGEGNSRSWEDAVKYGFISAGGGPWYSRTLNLLSPNDRVWVKIPGSGFVGVGRVLGPPEAAANFKVQTADGERPVLEVATGGNYHRELANDPERSEYFVPVEWTQAVSEQHAVNDIGLFGNQNTVCQPKTPKWRHTVEVLKQRFPDFDGTPLGSHSVNQQ